MRNKRYCVFVVTKKGWRHNFGVESKRLAYLIMNCLIWIFSDIADTKTKRFIAERKRRG